MEKVNNGVSIRFMKKSDIEEIMLIEQCSFPAPWSAKAFLNELQNKFARYFVLLDQGRSLAMQGCGCLPGNPYHHHRSSPQL